MSLFSGYRTFARIPHDDHERFAVTGWNQPTTAVCAAMRNATHCTLPPGHEGDHVAAGPGDRPPNDWVHAPILNRWPNTQPIPTLSPPVAATPPTRTPSAPPVTATKIAHLQVPVEWEAAPFALQPIPTKPTQDD